MSTLKCPQCGSPNVVQVDVNRYECPYCGKTFNMQEGMVAQQETFSSTPAPKKSSSKTTTIIIVMLLLAILAGGGWYAYQKYQKKHNVSDEVGVVDTIVVDTVGEDVSIPSRMYEEEEEMEAVEAARTNYQFTGLVNDKYEVVTNLRIKGNGVRGRYYYMSTYRKQGDVPSTYITLEGNIDEYRHVHLVGSFYNSDQVEIWDGYLKGNENEGYVFDAECVNDNGSVFHMVASTNN